MGDDVATLTHGGEERLLRNKVSEDHVKQEQKETK